jgi:hypothetical protein
VVKRLRPSAAVFREAHIDEARLTAQVPGPVLAELRAKLSVRSLEEIF